MDYFLTMGRIFRMNWEIIAYVSFTASWMIPVPSKSDWLVPVAGSSETKPRAITQFHILGNGSQLSEDNISRTL
jgi:hypothetical protein